MGVLMGCLFVIIIPILGPIIGYLGGFITGLVLNWLVGDGLVNGLNTLFNTTRFATDMLPVVCGALGVISSFFKSSVNIKKKG